MVKNPIIHRKFVGTTDPKEVLLNTDEHLR